MAKYWKIISLSGHTAAKLKQLSCFNALNGWDNFFTAKKLDCAKLSIFLLTQVSCFSFLFLVEPAAWEKTKSTNRQKGRSPGLVVLGDDSCSRGRGFESLSRIFPHLFVVKMYCLFEKDRKYKVGPFFKKKPDSLNSLRLSIYALTKVLWINNIRCHTLTILNIGRSTNWHIQIVVSLPRYALRKAPPSIWQNIAVVIFFSTRHLCLHSAWFAILEITAIFCPIDGGTFLRV